MYSLKSSDSLVAITFVSSLRKWLFFEWKAKEDFEEP